MQINTPELLLICYDNNQLITNWDADIRFKG